MTSIINRINSFFRNPYGLAVLMLALVMVCMKKWSPGGNLDEIWYRAVAKNIFLTGDYFRFFISKHYLSDIFDHFPLTYWVTATNFKIFGPSDFVARLYPMVCSIISYILVYLIGRKVIGKDFGLICLVSYALTFPATKWNGALMHDIPLTTYLLGTLYFFILGLEKPKKFLFCGVLCFLGIMTKGPIILGLPLGILLWSLWAKRFNFLASKYFWGGVVLLIGLLLAPLHPALHFGDTNVYMRFLGYTGWAVKNEGPGVVEYFAYFYLVLTQSPITVLPFIYGAYKVIGRKTSLSRGANDLLGLCFWVATAIIIPLSFFKVKFPHYLLPFFPPFAIVAAYPIYLLFLKKPFNLPGLLIKVSIVAAFIMVIFPIKTTGKRSKDLLNLVNIVKLDSNISDKEFYFPGVREDDFRIFQTFKYHGNIDLRSITKEELAQIPLKNNYLVIRKDWLPFKHQSGLLTEDLCLFQNKMYCIFTDRQGLNFYFPQYLFPHEVY